MGRRALIPGFEKYAVDENGTIWSYYHRKDGKQLSPGTHTGGYKQVCLYRYGFPNQRYVHRLVAQAFLTNPEELPEINHIDGNKGNNTVSNLQWVTSSQNTKHMFYTGLSRLKLTYEQVKDIRKDFRSSSVIANEYEVSSSYVRRIKTLKMRKEF